MVDVSIEASRAVFNVEGMHKLWSLRSRLELTQFVDSSFAKGPDA